jgi:hypothetical protein
MKRNYRRMVRLQKLTTANAAEQEQPFRREKEGDGLLNP